MRLVHLTRPGSLELNYLWLPTWIGVNAIVTKELQQAIETKVVGLPATEANLDIINEWVMDFLVDKFKEVTGLRDYLDGLKFIQP